MSERIVIAGCRGRMGAMLMERLSRSAAFQPVGLDLPYDEEDMEQACRGARVVLLCIPATAIAGTVEKLRPFMEPSTILSDITSVKELPMQHMESLWDGPVVGTHPLFGPVPAQDLELRVTIVPGRHASEEDVAFVESLFHSFCCVTFRATAEEHDMAEARIQGMNFITSAVYFAMTAEDPALLPYITPSFLRRMNSTEKQLMEDGALFTWLFEANPHSQAMVRQYR
ncbi:prephenate dehydrogenase/arogenate dehydrogenase family protein, partial [uncultured Mailhella sp.]|uniref:prephenate dehydrogenase/arogenate dehydrogenase family protein n=1 Tax=uncultured Mailhella sp. TaxID=1981031 RepID=UPI0025F5B1BF